MTTRTNAAAKMAGTNQSVQTYGTPRDLLHAVESRFGVIRYDLAANEHNHVCPLWIGERQNSLIQEWCLLDGLLWLNPPFAEIEPWAKKCAQEAQKGARILLLTPAAVGSEWFRQWVAPYAYTLILNPRVTFVGQKDPYPKDCMLAYFHAQITGFEIWRGWKGIK